MLYEEGYSDILPPQVGLNNQLECLQVYMRDLCARFPILSSLLSLSLSPPSVSISSFSFSVPPLLVHSLSLTFPASVQYPHSLSASRPMPPLSFHRHRLAHPSTTTTTVTTTSAFGQATTTEPMTSFTRPSSTRAPFCRRFIRKCRKICQSYRRPGMRRSDELGEG